MSDHAGPPLLCGQRGDLVVRSPELKRPDPLEVLRLEVDFVSGILVERAGREERSPVDNRAQDLVGGFDIREGEHECDLRIVVQTEVRQGTSYLRRMPLRSG